MINKLKNLSDLQESILILVTLQALLDEYKKCLLKEKKTDSVLFSIISSQIIITSCSYLEEWERLGKRAQENSKIIRLRKISKPAIDKIYSWSDMRKVRNSVLAHGLRNKSQIALSSFPPTLRCPSSLFDYKLLLGCIFITKNMLLRIFSDDYNEILPYLKNFKTVKPQDPIGNEEMFNIEFDKVIGAVQRNLNVMYLIKDE